VCCTVVCCTVECCTIVCCNVVCCIVVCRTVVCCTVECCTVKCLASLAMFPYIPISTLYVTLSLGPHCAYFRMRTFKPQVAKVSTACVEKTFALVAQHSERKCESSSSSSPNWLVVI